MKLVRKSVMVGLLAVMGPSIGAAQAQDGGVWGKIESTGVLSCGALTDQPPQSWQDLTNNQFHGYIPLFCEAVQKSLSEEMGKEITIEYVPTTWATFILDIQSGRVDLGSGLSLSPERLAAVDMPGPAYTLADTILVRKGFPVYNTWEEYNNPEVRSANQSGSSTERSALTMLPNAQQLSFKDRPSVVLALQSGQADITVSAFVSALGIMRDGASLFEAWVVPEPRNEQPSAFGVRKDGDGRFTAWLQEWSDAARADGTVEAIMRQSLDDAGLDTSDLSGLGK